MPENRGGFLIRFDEDRRAELLRERGELEGGFSDALSSNDWAVKEWEVIGLLLAPGSITHWALARKGKKVATGKVRVEFTEVTPTQLRLSEIERRVGPKIRRNIISARSGVGGRVPPATWVGMKHAVGEIDANSLKALERLERLRDQSRTFIEQPGAGIVAQERDAVGIALDVFDQTGQIRKRTLHGWAAPEGDRLSSFLEGLAGVRTIEDQLIARDTTMFPGAEKVHPTIVGAVFAVGGRKLEVFNVNRTAVESTLGVDLLYWDETFDAWTSVQYKLMERIENRGERHAVYRPDSAFDAELSRMREFRARTPDSWTIADGRAAYRLCGDGFYFKFCSRVQLEVLSESLLPGMYLPRLLVEATLEDGAARGPRGGRVITFENTQRHISNTVFAELVRDGWLGTRGGSSKQIASIVRAGLTARRAVVIARSRPAGDAANLRATLSALDV